MPTSTPDATETAVVSFHDILSDDGTHVRAWTNDPDGVIDGPTVVLCNGLGTNAYMWPALLDPDCGVRVVSWNHRGVGGSERPADKRHVEIEHFVEDGLSVMDHFGVDRAVLMGWSMGVNTMFELAVRHPERVAGLFAVAGVPGDTFRTMLAPLRLPHPVARLLTVSACRLGKLTGWAISPITTRLPIGPRAIAVISHSGFMFPVADPELAAPREPTPRERELDAAADPLQTLHPAGRPDGAVHLPAAARPARRNARRPRMTRAAVLVATVGYIGYAPVAPGTLTFDAGRERYVIALSSRIDGLFDGDPALPESKVIPLVDEWDDRLMSLASVTRSKRCFRDLPAIHTSICCRVNTRRGRICCACGAHGDLRQGVAEIGELVRIEAAFLARGAGRSAGVPFGLELLVELALGPAGKDRRLLLRQAGFHRKVGPGQEDGRFVIGGVGRVSHKARALAGEWWNATASGRYRHRQSAAGVGWRR